MASDPRLPALRPLSQLLKDSHLTALRKAEAEKAELLARLADLQALPPAPEDLLASAAVGVAMRYERWADRRRQEIEEALKLKAAECARLTAVARLSVGRDAALARLSKMK